MGIIDRDEALKNPIAMSMSMYFSGELRQTWPKTDMIYHYTGLDSFISIIENREFWISNVNFLNDRNEIEDGFIIFESVIKEKLNAELQSEERFFLNQLKSILSKRFSKGSWAIMQSDIFAMSFCEKGDLLTQWRSYGNDGGISIGFDYFQLCSCSLMHSSDYWDYIKSGVSPDEMLPDYGTGILPLKVVYSDEEKREIVEFIIDFALESLQVEGNNNDLTMAEISDVLLKYLALFKNEHFFSEQEIRYVLAIFKYGFKRYKINFRGRNGLALPYIKFKLLDKNCRPLVRLPIKDIIVGPCEQVQDKIRSIKYFLENTGNANLAQLVRESDIPYRG